MTDIPDDVVERACEIAHVGFKSLGGEARHNYIKHMRAALRVAVEWERNRVSGYVQTGTATSTPPSIYVEDAIHARSNPSN